MLRYAGVPPHLPLQPWAVLALSATVPAVTIALGAVTNAINGIVSQEYFVTILGWHHVRNVWAAAIAQGIFEGALYGVAFSLIVTVAVTVITGARCPYRMALRTLLLLAAMSLAAWIVGGLVAMAMAGISPEMYRATFIGVPSEFGPMLRYAWVGGSIWGILIGGLLATIVSLVLLHQRWKLFSATATATVPVPQS